MKAPYFLSILIMLCFTATAQVPDTSLQKIMDGQEIPAHIEKAADADGIFAIYPGNGIPPSSEKWTWSERTIQTENDKMARNVVIPTLTLFTPEKGNANGTAVIVAPGGAFTILSMQKEGYEVARWLNQYGITALVLKYRLAPTPQDDAELQPFLTSLFEKLPHPDEKAVDPPVGTTEVEEARLLAEEDGRQAIRYVRTHAEAFGIEPNKIGIMGFSAGGGIAVNVALEHDTLSRPDFTVGIYAGWRRGVPVPADAPPLFLAISDEDKLVGPVSSARLYEQWHQAGKPVSLHIFGSGEHGFGARENNTLSDAWTDLFESWLAASGFIDKR